MKTCLRLARFAPVFLLVAAATARAAPPIQQQLLPNGLTVIVVEDHAQPLVTVEIAFRNGSMTEPPEYNGLSHLYEHMFFKANQVLPDQEAWLARARSLGMVWNGTTSTERVNYFFSTTTDHLADTMAFMRDAIVTPLFDAGELEREKVVVTGEIDRNEGNPFYHWAVSTQRRVFWKYPSRKDPLGSRAAVLAATPAKMRTIQHRYYVPNNGALVVTGDVSAPDVFAQAGKLYAGWKRGPDPFVKFPLVRHPPLPHTSVVLVEQPVQGVAGQLVWPGPSTVPSQFADTYAADLIGYAVAEPSSRFQRALVDSGACLQASLSWYTQQNVGPISAQFQAAPGQAKTCIGTIREELERMKAPDYFSDEELANAAFRAEVDQVRSREQPSELAHTLSFWWASSSLDYYAGYVENLRKVKRPDIARFLDRWVLARPFVLGVMVSPETARAGLDLASLERLVGARPWKAAGKRAGKPSKEVSP
jgi:zinc protease